MMLRVFSQIRKKKLGLNYIKGDLNVLRGFLVFFRQAIAGCILDMIFICVSEMRNPSNKVVTIKSYIKELWIGNLFHIGRESLSLGWDSTDPKRMFLLQSAGTPSPDVNR